MAVKQTYSPGVNVSGRSPVDFAANVKTEEVNAVTTGLVKGAEANRLSAAEVDMASSVLKGGNPAARSALTRSAKTALAGAARRYVQIIDSSFDDKERTDTEVTVEPDETDAVIQLAQKRRARTMAREAALGAEEADGLAEAVSAATEAGSTAAAPAGTSVRSTVLESMKGTGGAAQAAASKVSLGSTAVADALDKEAIAQATSKTALSNPIASPLKEGNTVAKSSAEALAKTKSALIGKSATSAAATSATNQTAVARAVQSAKETIRSIVAMMSSGAAPVVALVMMFTVIITTVVVAMGAASAMSENGGKRMAQVAIEQYEKWNSSDAGTQNEMRSAYLAAGGQGGDAPWCSCFVTWCWKTCGFDQIMGVPGNPAWAASWLSFCDNPSVGTIIEYNSSYRPQPGDIIVDGARDASWSNHVGLVVSELNENGTFRVIHGNWNDAVGQAYYFPGQTGGQGERFTYVARPNYPASSGTALGEGVDFSMSETAFVREWAPRIDNWYKSWDPGAPLAGYGEEFARAAYRHKYDPRLSPAMSRMESGGGRYCFRPHNAWGWGSASWSSWPEAIEAHVAGLENGYSGMSITEIVNKYCPDGNEATYIANLERWFTEM